ncbi:hypothetical protein V6Z12_A01G213300 [Gossypium hirsutum]
MRFDAHLTCLHCQHRYEHSQIVQQIQNMMTHEKSDRETVLVRRMLQDGLLDVVCLKH